MHGDAIPSFYTAAMRGTCCLEPLGASGALKLELEASLSLAESIAADPDGDRSESNFGM
jgi:hypothetical protein